ncbi:MAG: alpha/beta fold hydrolase [Pseudomonadota bacterium]
MSEDNLDATSIRIIEAGYRSINNPAAFDDLVTAWKQRIDALATGAVRDLLSPALAQHCDELVKLLDTVGEPLMLSEHDSFVRKASGPAMVVSPAGTIIAINQSAADRFELAVGQRARFDFLDFASKAAFDQLREGCRKPANLYRAILQTEDRDVPDLLDAQIVATNRNAMHAVGLRTLGYEWSDDVRELMILAFELSDSEADVVGLLYQHADLARIAELRRTSVRTVRTQLHQIYSKTGTGGQVELIRMVALICAQEGRQESVLAEWRDPLGRECSFIDRHGNTISYTWMGAPEGEPAVLCHGPMTGHTFKPELIATLRAQNVKLYAIIRPGFGNSSAITNQPAHEAGAQAVLALADHLSLNDIVGIGLVNGIVPLIHASAARPGLFRTLLGLGSTAPIQPDRFDEQPAMQATIFRLAHESPSAFDAFIRTGYRAALNKGPEYVLSRMYEGSPADQAVLADPDTLALLKASTAMVMTQGHEAFIADVLMVSHDFRTALKSAAPLTMICGGSDPIYRIANMRDFADENKIEIVEVAGAGQTVYHTHAHDTANAIRVVIGSTTQN